ncbi:MAG TPA: GMC family oxidoreductase N-terminal domain-containing protein [Thermomicrobiales bacterium]|nr:GMC family oxidoreductase N-terminal domain-containing protein [Thermomicrobiales bacterium]
MAGLPRQIDVLVVGGGTSGAALAGIIARDTTKSVVLLEAGPDFGPLDGGRWPADLLDARRFALSHDWGYDGINHASQPDRCAFPRARVIGGCGAHNGCVAVAGHRLDYDGWAAAGNPGWDWASVAPAFARAREALRVRVPDASELNPFQASFLDASVAAGFPRVENLDVPDLVNGVAPAPFNIHNGTRWSSALGYLDPVRGNANLTVVGGALVDRVVINGGQAVAVEATIDSERTRIEAGTIVLSGGAYGSPAILLRSGVGDPAQLRDLGVDVVHELAGVGKMLTDHPISSVQIEPSERLLNEMNAFKETGWLPDEQVVLLASSRHARQAAFDLHFPAYSSQDPATGEWRFQISVGQFDTASYTGTLTLTSLDPAAPPAIDHGYLSDTAGRDRDTLVHGLEIGLDIVGKMVDNGYVATILAPDPTRLGRDDLIRHLEMSVRTCYHPGCSCRMGPTGDPTAVVDTTGAVHGLRGLHVCDASIFPILPRANNNLPAAMLAEMLAPVIGRNA